MMRFSTSTLIVLIFVAIVAFALGWLMGEDVERPSDVQADTRPSPAMVADADPPPSFQNHIDVAPLQSQRIAIEGEPPVQHHFSIDQSDTQTLSRSGQEIIIGLVEVESEHVKLNLNNQEYILQSGNYIDTPLAELTCRLLLLQYDWSSSSRNAEFSFQCEA